MPDPRPHLDLRCFVCRAEGATTDAAAWAKEHEACAERIRDDALLVPTVMVTYDDQPGREVVGADVRDAIQRHCSRVHNGEVLWGSIAIDPTPTNLPKHHTLVTFGVVMPKPEETADA